MQDSDTGPCCRGYEWRRLVDTGLEAPDDAVLDDRGAEVWAQVWSAMSCCQAMIQAKSHPGSTSCSGAVHLNASCTKTSQRRVVGAREWLYAARIMCTGRHHARPSQGLVQLCVAM